MANSVGYGDRLVDNNDKGTIKRDRLRRPSLQFQATPPANDCAAAVAFAKRSLCACAVAAQSS